MAEKEASPVKRTEDSTWRDLLKAIPELLAPSLAEEWPMLPIRSAEGIYVVTPEGERYMDFTSGIAVANVGHNHPKVVHAAQEQLARVIHSAVGLTVHESVLRLCEALGEVTPTGLTTFFFGNSGAEAVEGAIKLARFVSRRPAIIAFEGGFHGRSFGAASVTSVKSRYRLGYEPFVPGVYFAPYAYPYRCPIGPTPQDAVDWSLRGIQRLFDHQVPPSQVAAFILEPVLGEGGYVVPPAEFLHALRRICDEKGILLIFDEVQTGFGRTGEMFAAQTFDVRPDIMAIAKGIAAGFPLSATVASPELMRRWEFGSHGTTYGGNPVACAAGLASLQVIREEGLLENCRAMGDRFKAGLEGLAARYPEIGEVRGVGLMLALEMVQPGKEKRPRPDLARSLLTELFQRRLIALSAGTYGHVVRFMPPLIVDASQVDEALAIVGESLACLLA